MPAITIDAMTQHPDYQQVDDKVRARRLTQAVIVMSGSAKVESQSQFNASLIRGRRPNHLLHAFLTFFTCGLWALVWVWLMITMGEIRLSVMVDDYGRVYVSEDGRAWVQHSEFEV